MKKLPISYQFTMNNKRVLSKVASITLMGVMFAGCGGGGGSTGDTTPETPTTPTEPTTTTVAGTAIDGYLSGSTVCVDIDDDGICDDGTVDVVSTTNNDGTFSFSTTKSVSGHKILVYGGIDTATGEDFVGLLKSTPSSDSSSVITPLTTLITEVGDETKVKAMLNIPQEISLLNYDHIASINANETNENAKAVLSANMKTQAIIATSVNAIGGTTNEDRVKVAGAVTKSIGSLIASSYATSSTTKIDLTDQVKINAILSDATLSNKLVTITGATATTGTNLTNINKSISELNKLIDSNVSIANTTAAVKIASDVTKVAEMKTTALTSNTASTLITNTIGTLANTTGVFTNLKSIHNNIIEIGTSSYKQQPTTINGTFSKSIAPSLGFDILNYCNISMTIDNAKSTFKGQIENERTIAYKISNGSKSIKIILNNVIIDDKTSNSLQVSLPKDSSINMILNTDGTEQNISLSTSSTLMLAEQNILSFNLHNIKNLLTNENLEAFNSAIGDLSDSSTPFPKTYSISVGINSNNFVFPNAINVPDIGKAFRGYVGTLTFGDSSGVSSVTTNLQFLSQNAVSRLSTATTQLANAQSASEIDSAVQTTESVKIAATAIVDSFYATSQEKATASAILKNISDLKESGDSKKSELVMRTLLMPPSIPNITGLSTAPTPVL